MVKVVYPVPNETPETWEIFAPVVDRFCTTWRLHPPGCDCQLVPILFGPDPTGIASDLFKGLPVDFFHRYKGGGCDIGAAQEEALLSDPDDFIVALTSRVYFHRAGWLNHLKTARELYGKGLYGTSASREGGHLHCCTRCYAMDAEIWHHYPHFIDSRDQGTFFEVGDHNPVGGISDWVEAIGLPVLMVYWDGVRRKENWFTPDNIFRRGNQENLLVWDKHTKLYTEADQEEKRRLEADCFFGVDITAQSTPLKQ